jgi:hypothetical protein
LDNGRKPDPAMPRAGRRPKPDSLAPAVDYIKKDLLHMIDTFQWK